RRVGVAAPDRMLLYVGRLAREKNVELLLRALALCANRNVKLVIAGDGPQREELVRLAVELGIAGEVRFLGAVARQQLTDLYASADAFVMASTTETQGLVLAEALAAGARVIAADAPQNRDVVDEAGTLVAARPEAFAAAFGAVIAGGDRRPIEARLAARRFSIEAQAERMDELYAGLRRAVRIA
ncbi:MAG: glycosyltransferase, partial [Candidatus Eremiobacteraeota bacterium]|nr:glycosyltransferase [Candidatus Eremiobacteraeota bacterium]